jgi:YHS domain-containing protein
MRVDKAKAIRMDFGAETFYFCSQHCLHAFEASRGPEPMPLTAHTE